MDLSVYFAWAGLAKYSTLFAIFRFLDWLGFRCYRVLYDDYRVPLICQWGFHELDCVVNGSAR